MVRIFRVAMGLLVVFALTTMLMSPAQASACVWITLDPPCTTPVPGSVFTTDLKASSWQGVAGALDFTIHYDPTVLHIIDFSVPSDSPFYPNLAINSDSYASGETRIAGFQVRDSEPWEIPITIGILTWQVVGAPGLATDVTIEVTSVVAADWSPIEVLTYGQHIAIGKTGDVNNDDHVNVLDMILIAQHWGETGSSGWIPEDVVRDGVINVLDMVIIGQHWTG